MGVTDLSHLNFSLFCFMVGFPARAKTLSPVRNVSHLVCTCAPGRIGGLRAKRKPRAGYCSCCGSSQLWTLSLETAKQFFPPSTPNTIHRLEPEPQILFSRAATFRFTSAPSEIQDSRRSASPGINHTANCQSIAIFIHSLTQFSC